MLFRVANGTGEFTPNHEPKYRYELYNDLLSTVRRIIISQMPKPEEVLIVEVDGEPVREFAKDTDTIELYKAVRITLGESNRQAEAGKRKINKGGHTICVTLMGSRQCLLLKQDSCVTRGCGSGPQHSVLTHSLTFSHTHSHSHSLT